MAVSLVLLVYVCVCVLCIFFCFFFFKQKTAYEMRISDWSSDVCSSDLLKVHFGAGSDDALDDEPFALDGLQRYSAAQTVLHAAIDPAVTDPDHAIAHAAQRLHDEGLLPPGGFGAALQIGRAHV